MKHFERGDIVRKRSGSQWQGKVVGEYSSSITAEGYAVESDTHKGSVQIYPAAALEPVWFDFDEQRIDVVGSNGNDGLHYDVPT